MTITALRCSGGHDFSRCMEHSGLLESKPKKFSGRRRAGYTFIHTGCMQQNAYLTHSAAVSGRFAQHVENAPSGLIDCCQSIPVFAS